LGIFSADKSHISNSQGKPQISPLRYAPVEMTNLLQQMPLSTQRAEQPPVAQTNLSSRTEESWACGPPKVMKNAFCPRPLSHGDVALTVVISTEANPDFLLRGTGQGRVCAFLQGKAHKVCQRHQLQQEIRGSAAERSLC
jgi:hypothetical protein